MLHEISQNVRHMMEELWLNWSHLGVDDKTKVDNINTLVQIEKELHRDVISETRQKLKTMQGQVDSKFVKIIFQINIFCNIICH